MTSYHGGKQKVGKEIADMIATALGDEKMNGYCEPFCGMLGVYQHIPSLLGDITYLAGDAQESVIKMWSAAQKGWKPPMYHVSQAEFEKYSADPRSSPEKGFIGHQYAMRGKYFKTYMNRNGTSAAQNVVRIAQLLPQVHFTSGNYDQFSTLTNFAIYCDPPYQKQNNYYGEKHDKRAFDHNKFWTWCRKMSKNNIVFVSEYEAPKDFTLIWEEDGGQEKLYIV